MSNCIRPVGKYKTWGTLLESSHFSGLIEASDAEGNRVTKEKDGWVLRMGELTTWRGFRAFLWKHVQPYITVSNLRADTIIEEEGDGFEEAFTMTIRFFPPGSVPGEDWRKIY